MWSVRILLLLLFVGVFGLNKTQAQNKTLPDKRGNAPRYYPWAPPADSVLRGVHNVTIGTHSSGDAMQLEFQLSAPQMVSIRLYNLAGHSVASRDVRVEPRMKHQEVLMLGHLSTGYYILLLETTAGREVRKFFRP